MKKKMVLSLASLMAFSAIAFGCSSGNDSNNGSKTGTGGETGGTLPPYEINLVYMGNETADLALVAAEMSKITKEKMNATVKLTPIGAGAWSQQVNLMLASQEKIDVIMASSLYAFSSQAAAGHFLPLDELLGKHGKGITGLVDPSYLNAGKINGVQYAIPTNKDMATAGGVIMRKDLLDKYKIDISSVKKLDDLDAVFEVIKKNEPNLIPIASITSVTPVDVLAFYDPLVDKNGVLLRDNASDLKVVNMYEQPQYAELLKTMRRWYQAGYFSRDAATTTEPQHEVVKANRAFAFFNVMKVGTAESQSLRTGMEMVTIPMTEPFSATSHVTNFMHAIPRGSQDSDRAMMFLDLLYTDAKLINLLNWGIEGKHYVKVSDTVINYPQGVDVKTVGYSMNNQSFMFGNQFLNYVWPNQLPDIWKQTDEYNKKAEKSVALGFTFDSAPVKTEVGAVSNVLQQYKAGLETGTLDPDKTLPDFISRLKSAGMDKIIAEKQKQLDKWKASVK